MNKNKNPGAAHPYSIYKSDEMPERASSVDRFDVMLCVVLLASIMIGLIAMFFSVLTTVGLLLMMILAVLMLAGIIVDRRRRPISLRERQSDRMIAVATRTTSLLRQGLTEETAMEACSTILEALPTIDAVALTDERRVLGYAGFGCIHHQQWRDIKSAYTKICLRDKMTQVVSNIECIDSCCPLKSAIIVAILVGDRAVGTIKFYYTEVSDITEDEIAMAESLAGLVSVQLEVHELEKEAAFVREMELKMLQAQIDPHFLFNTLNTIASLIRTDPQKARELVSKFAQFYRYTLTEDAEEETLQNSIDIVRRYFDLEHARFEDRLNLHIAVDESLLSLRMPRYMLQPLVENSIRHGMRYDGTPLNISVTAAVDASGKSPCIRLSVIDDGQGTQRGRIESILTDGLNENGLGMALRNVNSRLKHYYGTASEMEFFSEEDRGTEVSYRIPYRPEQLEQ